MNKIYNVSFQVLVQKFFQQRLMQQKKVSGKTVDSYRDTFKIYFKFLQDEYETPVSNIDLKHMDMDHVLNFCHYLKKTRNNKAVTINNRLAAIHSFMKYVAETMPEYCELASRVLLIPFQKTEIKTMDFINKKEFEAIISVCDTTNILGARDKLMFLIMYNTGLRVSELILLSYDDIKDLNIPNRTCLKVYGKGRKERIVPIWKTTSLYLNEFIEKFNIKSNNRLFIGKNGENLTRSGVRFRIDICVKKAKIDCPSLTEKVISPHTFRHSVAMNLLQSGVDISTIAIWLGHSSIETTHKYMVADIELKRKAMESVAKVNETTLDYHPSNDLLSFLDNL